MSAKLSCELREIVLRDKPAHMVEISPKATVPVLQLPNGTVLEESLDIVLWSLDANDPEQLLDPPSGSKQDMLDLIEQSDVEFKPLLDRYKYSFHAEPELAKAARDNAVTFLQILDQKLADAFLFGNRIALADICILPFVRQFASVDKDWFEAQEFKNTIEWLNAFLVSDRFSSIMSKFPLWAPGNPTIIFPSQTD